MPLNASEPLISLTGPAHLPLRVRLAGALRDAIRSGQLAGGTTLRSTRIFAQDLGLSRRVVVDAYAQLAAEGFVRGRPGAATTVVYLQAGALPAGWQNERPVAEGVACPARLVGGQDGDRRFRCRQARDSAGRGGRSGELSARTCPSA